jgi:hypothetical protein
VEIALDL